MAFPADVTPTTPFITWRQAFNTVKNSVVESIEHATLAPTATDYDYPLGSIWTKINTDDVYILTDNTGPSSAVWIRLLDNTGDAISVDTISEATAAAGVTIDGTLIKDNVVGQENTDSFYGVYQWLENHTSNAIIDLESHAASATLVPRLQFSKSRGAGASPTQITAADELGEISWFGRHATAWAKSAWIKVISTTNTGTFGSKMEFHVDATLRLAIDENGDFDLQAGDLTTTGALAASNIGSISGKDYWSGTQAAYDGLGSWDANTIYFITN